MKAIDIRSESAVKLLAEFLDMDIPYEPGHRYVNAEHFAHGESWLTTDVDSQKLNLYQRFTRMSDRHTEISSCMIV